MKSTKILVPLDPMDKENLKSHKDNYKSIKTFINKVTKKDENMTFEEVLEKLELSEDEYMLALRSSLKGPKVFLRRNLNERTINAYNRDLLILWQGNMDIQIILDPYATCAYVCNYSYKGQKGMSKLMRDISNTVRKGSLSLQQTIRMYVNQFIKHSEISAQEAVYHLLGIPKAWCSIGEVFINTFPPEKRKEIKKSRQALLEIMEQDELSTDGYHPGLIEHYVQRPYELNHITLAEFACKYVYYGTSRAEKLMKFVASDNVSNNSEQPITDHFETESESEDAQLNTDNEHSKPLKFYKLKDNTGYVKERAPVIIRYRNYNFGTEESDYYRENVMLFTPWDDEEYIIENAEKLYKENLYNIINEKKKYNHDRAVNFENVMRDQMNNEEDSDPEDDEETRVAKEFQINELRSDEADVALDVPIMQVEDEQQSIFTTSLVFETMPDKEYHDLINSLNSKQRAYFLNLLHLVKTRPTEQFLHLITGFGGAGKSRLLKAIIQGLNRYWVHQIGNKGDCIFIIVCAPTGCAAYLISGLTIHCVFSFDLNIKKQLKQKLNPDKLNTLRAKFKNLKLLVIDEISMVSADLFQLVNKRLQEIFNNENPMGSVSTLILGDFHQLKPIHADWVFKGDDILKDSYITLNVTEKKKEIKILVSHLWMQFKLYELTEIMRHKSDKTFAEALINLAHGTTTPEDDALFASREMTALGLSEADLPDNVVGLYYTNKDVDKYNNRTMERKFPKGVIAEAIDVCTGPGSQKNKQLTLDMVKAKKYHETAGLIKSIDLRVGAKYMLTLNLDTNEGLVNGAVGKLTAVIMGERHDGSKIPLRIYLEFDDTKIGKSLRDRSKQIIKVDKQGGTSVPFERVVKQFDPSYGSLRKINRKQFPFVPCQGKTVAKSQGRTEEAIMVGTNLLDRRHKYVAFSRTRSLDNLYINGKYTRPNPPPEDDPVNPVINQMKNERPVKFILMFPEDLNLSYVLFHNIRSLNRHKKHVESSATYMNASVLLFSESWLLPSDNIKFENFKPIYRRDCKNNKRSASGCYIAVKKDLHSTTELIQSEFIEDTQLKGYADVVTIAVSDQFITLVHKSPTFNTTKFEQILHNHLELINLKKPKFWTVVGDFNLEHSKISKVTDQFNLTNCLNDTETTDYHTCIDLCLSQNDQTTAHIFESPISDHKPIWFHSDAINQI